MNEDLKRKGWESQGKGERTEKESLVVRDWKGKVKVSPFKYT